MERLKEKCCKNGYKCLRPLERSGKRAIFIIAIIRSVCKEQEVIMIQTGKITALIADFRQTI